MKEMKVSLSRLKAFWADLTETIESMENDCLSCGFEDDVPMIVQLNMVAWARAAAGPAASAYAGVVLQELDIDV